MSDEIGETLARVCRGVGSHQEGDAVLNWVTNLQRQLKVALTGLAAVHEAERRREAIASESAEFHLLIDLLTPAERDTLIERRRQINIKGHSPADDDKLVARELARAGSAYLTHYYSRQWLIDSYADGLERYQEEEAPDEWPWEDLSSWKPKNRRQDLIRVGALVLAEIDRLDRCVRPQGASSCPTSTGSGS